MNAVMGVPCSCTGEHSVIEIYPQILDIVEVVIDEAIVERSFVKQVKIKCHTCGRVYLDTMTMPPT